MSRIFFLCLYLYLLCFVTGCKSQQVPPIQTVKLALTDHAATPETVALYRNLKSRTADKFMFGHQETLAYGIGWHNDQTGDKSDVKDVCGDFPAVYGWDIGDIGQETNVDGVRFDEIITLIKIAYARGGVNTISMHLDNPVTGGNAWDNSPAVSQILPGGTHHDKFMQTLDLVAAFMKELKADDGTFIPVIFRPFHEHNQTWPWWGVSACTEDEFVALWKMTVNYLRDDHNIHHLIFAISPQDIHTASKYLIRYPGDDYVDILGIDYWRWSYEPDYISVLTEALNMLGKEAQERNKVAALTEVGFEKIPIARWWTEYLLQAFEAGNEGKNIAWALVWRNKDTTHHYGPYPGHGSAADFIQFYESPSTLFQKDIPDMYRE